MSQTTPRGEDRGSGGAKEFDLDVPSGDSAKGVDVNLCLFILLKVCEDESVANLRFMAHLCSGGSWFFGTT